VGWDEGVLVLAPPGVVADAADGVAVVDDVAVLVDVGGRGVEDPGHVVGVEPREVAPQVR
jgi:hypothetical protein